MKPNEMASTPHTTVTGQIGVTLVNWIAKSAATITITDQGAPADSAGPEQPGREQHEPDVGDHKVIK